MNHFRRGACCGLVLLVAGPLALRGDEAAVRGVSPGAKERVVEATSSCPSFSWSAVEGASAYRLALFETRPDGGVEPVFTQRIEGAALSWTPPRERCLAPGREYAWVVQAERGSAEALGAWSAPLRFRVPGVPSEEEVRAALELLGRWQAAGGEVSGVGSSSAEARGDEGGPGRGALQTEASTATGIAAIRGEIADVSGEAYGMFGISHSPQGAGVVARNESSGADLVLDGEAQGQADTLLTQSGIDRPSASAQTFEIGNSGAGAMTLTVDGVEVVTVLTDQDSLGGLSCGEGQVAKRIGGVWSCAADEGATYAAGNQLELVGTTFNVLEGAGSGLDADTLDGLQGSAYALSGHAHAGEQIVAGTVAEPRIATEITRDDEVFPIVLANDGTGSGLDADTLDGSDSSAFQVRISGGCPDGEAIRSVNPDGSVVCSGAAAPATRVSTLALGAFADFHSIAIGSDGLPVLAYCDQIDGLVVAKCNDLACSGNNETITLLDACYWEGPVRIRVGANGFPVISYGRGAEIWIARCNDVACAGGDETFTPLGPVTRNYHTSLAIGGDGFPVLSYYLLIQSDLVVAKCDDFGCSEGAPTVTVVDDAGSVGQFTSIATGTDGFPVISYHDAATFALKVAKCNTPSCAPWPYAEIATVDDTANHVGLATSIAIGVDGYPVISYYDATAFTLKVAKCNDSACAGGNETITIVDDPTNQVGFFTSIAIGTDGLPVIAYCDDNAHALKVAKCNDRACRNGDETITTLVPGTVLTGTLELAIGVDGFPIISYIGRTGSRRDLMVAKCANASCR